MVNPYQAPRAASVSRVGLNEASFVRNLGFAVIGYIILNALLLAVLTGGAVGAIVKGVIRIVLAVFMINGANWARWIFALGGLFSALLGLVAIAYLPQEGISRFGLVGIWILLGAAFDATVGVVLMFSERVNKYFGT